MVVKFCIAAVIISLGCSVIAEDSKTKENKKNLQEISINELATIIDTLVDEAIAEKESEPLVAVIEDPSYLEPISVNPYFNNVQDDIPSFPVHKIDPIRSENVIAKRARTFQYYGSRGKKAFDYSSGKRLFNYMPSRG